MATQELINWAKESLAKGHTLQQLQDSLLKNGHQQANIDELFRIINQPVQQNQELNQSNPVSEPVKKSFNWKIVIIVAAILLGIIIIALLFSKVKSGGSVNSTEPLKVTWGDFVQRTDMGDDIWEMEIEIANPETEMVILELYGEDKEGGWSLYIEESTRPSSFRPETIEVSFGLEERFFDKKKITLFVYECSKLSEDIKTELCISTYGLSSSPWRFIEKRQDEGNSIEPTTTYIKYFNYDSLEHPPQEITAEEYEK